MDLNGLTLRDFQDRIAEKAPTPGGGAVVGVCGALAASLATMVTRYSQGRPKAAEHEPAYRRAVEEFARAAEMFTQLAQEDLLAYAALNDAMKLDKDDPARAERMPEAVRAAVRVPMSVMALAASLMRKYRELAPIANPWLLSDLAIATELTAASALAASHLVKANASLLKTFAPGDGSLADATDLAREITQLRGEVLALCG
ncbi:MAG: cyclodeaminase/cyclohydrolase family protein [Phycisphaerales bacterium]